MGHVGAQKKRIWLTVSTKKEKKLDRKTECQDITKFFFLNCVLFGIFSCFIDYERKENKNGISFGFFHAVQCH